MVFFICMREKCGFVLFIDLWLLIVLGFQLFMKWYLLLFVWRGR
jgi:hypothetical protein